MKRYIIFLLLILVSFSISAQRGSRDRHNRLKEKVTEGFRGELKYENNRGLKATLSKDIFDVWKYEDSNNNQLTYSKEIWPRISRGADEYDMLYWFVDNYSDRSNYSEKLSIDIFDNLQYEGSNNFKASISNDIFDNGIYKDSNGNETTYSKEFWKDFIANFDNDELAMLFWMRERFVDTKNYRESYKINIFGEPEYSNSLNQSAKIKKDFSNRYIYTDSDDNEMVFTSKRWTKLVKRYGGINRIFLSLVSKELLDNPYRSHNKMDEEL